MTTTEFILGDFKCIIEHKKLEKNKKNLETILKLAFFPCPS
jgi:hypothetical protein